MIKSRHVLKENKQATVLEAFETTVDITVTETDVTFDFFCKNSQFFSAGDKYNDPIFDGDVCEAFISIDGTIHNYYEIEVAPNNTIFLNKVHNPGNGKFELTEIPESENFIKASVEFLGNDYRLIFSLPLDKIYYSKEDGILFNAFRIETEGGHTDLHLLSLNPTLCDTFHMSEYFVKLNDIK